MSKILIGDNSEQTENPHNTSQKDNQPKSNIFQGRTDSELENAKFPDWDILPPNQFINPRIKQS